MLQTYKTLLKKLSLKYYIKGVFLLHICSCLPLHHCLLSGLSKPPVQCACKSHKNLHILEAFPEH